MAPKKKQSMKAKYHEHAGEERALHGHHKPKSKAKAFHRFEEAEEEKMHPGMHKKIKKMYKKSSKKSK